MKPLCLIDGVATHALDALDRGLHYGDGVFRTLRVVAGKARWWQDHYRKLAADCAALALPCPRQDVLEDEVRQVAAAPEVAVVKILVTRGSGRRGYAMPPKPAPTRMVMGFAGVGNENADVRVRWCNLRLSAQPRLAGIKHLNRLENVLARSEWDAPEIAEGLLQDEAGDVIGGTMSNLFLAEGGNLVTPELARTGVAGVARSRIIRAGKRHGRPVGVERITRQRLLAADGVFLVNSLIGVWRVAQLENRHWPDDGRAQELRSWLDETD